MNRLLFLNQSAASTAGARLSISAAITPPDRIENRAHGGADGGPDGRSPGAEIFYSYVSCGYVTHPHQFTGGAVSFSINPPTSSAERSYLTQKGAIGSGSFCDDLFTVRLCLEGASVAEILEALQMRLRRIANRSRRVPPTETEAAAQSPTFVEISFDIGDLFCDEVTQTSFFSVFGIGMIH